MRKYLFLAGMLLLPTPVFGAYNSNSITVTYVGDKTSWANTGDIGAQINAAYAAAPAAGIIIQISPKTGGGCYSYSTPIVATTSGKYILLEGSAPANNTPVGSCLNYTPTTATSAITFDYVENTNPPPTQSGLSNITLSNNACSTSGGCGSSAIGIKVGNSNYGDANATYSNVSLVGFGIAYSNNNNISVSETWINPLFLCNTQALSLGNGIMRFYGGVAAAQGKILVQVAGTSSEITFNGTTIDSTTSAPVFDYTANAAQTFVSNLILTDVHLENSPTAISTHYIQGPVNLQMKDGAAEDDSSTGSTDWMFQITGVVASVVGTRFISSRPYTSVFNMPSPVHAFMVPLVTAGINLPTFVDGANASLSSVLRQDSGGGHNTIPWYIDPPLTLGTSLIIQGGTLALPSTAVGSLPTCNSGSKGQIKLANDATAPTYLTALTGGSSVLVIALCNGTNWVAD